MKKFFALFLAVMMLMTLAIPAFAEETTTPQTEPETPTETTGSEETTSEPTYPDNSITINKAAAGETYKIYKMLDLVSYNNASKAYYYTIDSAWTEFFEDGNPGANYIQNVTAGAQTYVEWKAADQEDATVAAFAKAALAWASEKGITATDSKKADASTVVFENLDLGYYLVSSSLGTLCNLTTTDPHAVIEEKNGLPLIDKEVKEDSTSIWGKENDADMFQPIEYKIIVTVDGSGVNYVVHDTMEAGLSFANVTGVTLIKKGETEEKTVDADHYVVNRAPSDGHTFDVELKDALLATLVDYDQIIIYYTALLNANAEIYGEVNTNTVYLTFGESGKTAEATTNTKTYSFDLVKTDANKNLLDGAKFRLYNASTDGAEISVVNLGNGAYRLANSGETGAEIVPVNGKATIYGVDGQTTYYLEETEAPAGYNKLSTRQSVRIVANNLSAIVDLDNNTYTSGGVQIVNQTGTVLPETGGFGTTLFIVLGGLTVLTAGVLLFVKKRMEQVAE